MKRSTNIIGFPNLEDKVLKDKVSEEVLEDVLKVIVHKVEWVDSCLKYILVEGLGFGSSSNKNL